MRTIKATFSGGGQALASFEVDCVCSTIKIKNLPDISEEFLGKASIGSFYGFLERHAEKIGETVVFEDDKGPLMPWDR